ncbi:MAG: hypothetical protein Q8M92_11085 [Candidatus Subteraquimicrobiales bacterium]|nr:hypothetical protein [Candidatus Subteraquimicrobiales bacterium]
MQKESQFSPEQENSEPATSDITKICVEVLGDEVAEDFEGLEFEDALGYAYTLLLENGHDPDKIFLQNGLTINS